MRWQFKRQGFRLGKIIKCHRSEIVISWGMNRRCINAVINGHTERFVKIYRVLIMPAIQQESLLHVIFFTVVPQNGVQSRIQTAIGLIPLGNGVITKCVGTAKIVLRSSVADGWIL